MRLRLTLALLTLACSLAAAATAQARPVLGFNDNFNAPADVALSKSTGATTDRMFVRWDYVEGVRGHYNWRITDAQYKNLRAAGMTPMWVMIGVPPWAQDPSCTRYVTCPHAPAFDPDYQRFLAAFAQRYPQSAAIEIGNEVNLDNKWETPDPVRYTQILKAAHAAIKSVAPQIPVLVGGLCPGGVSGRTIAASDFLGAIYRNGGKGSFEGIGWHVYVGGEVPTIARDVKSVMAQGRQVRDANGDSSPFWITETGFPSNGRSPYSGVVFSEQKQADMTAIDYRVLASMPDVHAIYFFRLLDTTVDGAWNEPPDLLAAEKSMGFYRLNHTPKPVLKAFEGALSAPAWPDYKLGLGAEHSAIRSGQDFHLRVRGYDGKSPVTYEWLIWHTDHWSLPIKRTSSPSAAIHIYRPGRYSLIARMITDRDTYMSNRVDVAVMPKAKAKPKKKAKAKRKARSRRKSHAKRRVRHRPAATSARPSRH